ncbi:hypothetical protein SVIO_034120 [Streptomyces violaceusniger]|uniref:Uncharacterized protein n=1 Tax=Streptomyces violaceusniger TaxID=68280 RepID=A0A4D4L439_STRVO|nr:hypothetical protein SVIO_034120 [Streptomyces violaceusniger]
MWEPYGVSGGPRAGAAYRSTRRSLAPRPRGYGASGGEGSSPPQASSPVGHPARPERPPPERATEKAEPGAAGKRAGAAGKAGPGAAGEAGPYAAEKPGREATGKVGP